MIFYIWAKLLKKIRGKAIINSKIHKTAKINSGSQLVNSVFGRYSYCGYDCNIIHCNVGAYCSIASNVSIGGARHPIEWVSTSPVFQAGRSGVSKKFASIKVPEGNKTIIGNDVWIGENVLIKQGVKIGDGAVIGMGSVVTKDVEPYCIVGGNPAKIIRKRFEDDIVLELLKIKWWDFDDLIIAKYAHLFETPEIFIREVNK